MGLANKKKIVLVVPNSEWFGQERWDFFPYNLCLLSAVIEPEYEVEIIDCNIDRLSIKDSVRRIFKRKPEFIGITNLAVEYSKQVHALSARLKKTMPDVSIILGGVYCTLMPKLAMADPYIDYCVLGEGEIVIKELLRSIMKNILPENIDGVAYRKNDELIIKPQKTFIDNLDSLPFPNYDKIDFKKYGWINRKFSFTDTRDDLPVAKIYTSRGCPTGCNFCAVHHINGKKYRSRSVENVLHEIQMLIEKYGIKEIIFYDDNLILDRERAKKLFEGLIERKFNIKFKPVNIAVYCLDEEMLDLMKEAGCTTLILAIESASERVLKKIMKKPILIDKVPVIVNYAKKLGFRCAALFVIGSPEETWDEIRDTFKFAENLKIYCHFSIATPLPETRLYKETLEKGYLTEDFTSTSGSGCSRGWLLTSEFSPFDLEILRLYEWDRINFSTTEKRKRSADFFKVKISDIEEFSRSARVNLQKRYVREKYKRLL